MQFHPNYPTDNNKGQRELWRQIKDTLSQDEGVAYYRYPIFATTGRGRKEPDFLIVHRRYGINVINLRPNSLFCRKISSIHHHLKESEMNSVPAVPTTDQAVLPKII